MLTYLTSLVPLASLLYLAVPIQGDASGTTLIDPDDSYQIGMLVGMTGGSIPDAAVMRYALDCFKQIHGRPAATQDIGIVLGLIDSQNGGGES